MCSMDGAKGFKRKKNLFQPHGKKPYRLSRFRLEEFINCPRCFYLDRRLGIEPPPIPSFTLNTAVDALLKKEFDSYRQRGEVHPLMKKYGIDAVPFKHPKLDEWRSNFKGLQWHHRATNLIITGAVDDIWLNSQGDLLVVDYKATSTQAMITLETEYRQSFKRQMEIYQWLLRAQGFRVSDTSFFVYCNADRSRESFESRLEFDIQIIPYQGNDQWVENVIEQAYQCLVQDEIPDYSPKCPFCQYLKACHFLDGEKTLTTSFPQELFE